MGTFTIRLLLFVFLAVVPLSATPACPKTPENPSLVLFLAGSGVLSYRYAKARLFSKRR